MYAILKLNNRLQQSLVKVFLFVTFCCVFLLKGLQQLLPIKIQVHEVQMPFLFFFFKEAFDADVIWLWEAN